MAYTAAGLNAAVNGIAGAGTYISMHTGDPSTTGANEVAGGTYARVQTTWGSASSGSRIGTQVAINIPAATTATHWGIFSASTVGTFIYGGTLAANEAFGSAGVLNHTPTITVS